MPFDYLKPAPVSSCASRGFGHSRGCRGGLVDSVSG